MLRKMHRRMWDEKGFTLIEVIVSLVLIGIMAAIAGMGLVRIVEGYVFAKKNAETAQKAQIAIARIAKELGAATGITAAGTASITYTRTGSGTIIISFVDPDIKVSLDGGTTFTTLINEAAFAPLYFNAAGAPITPPVTTAPELASIRRIDFNLTVSGANNTSLPFNNNSVFIHESY
jgi:prepilin-type N-terminal cleavage/methylation domain-containing protein